MGGNEQYQSIEEVTVMDKLIILKILSEDT
jgi:hypothetical protein